MELKPHQLPGYTLIELTIVVGLTSILAISITAIMLSSLLSSTHVRKLIQVRQTGDYTINQLQQLIHNAQTIDACSSADNSLVITNQDGDQTTIFAESISDTEYKIASASSRATLYFNDETMPANNFNITCLPTDDNPNLIQIQFTLTTNSQSNRPFEKPLVKFETSIELRN